MTGQRQVHVSSRCAGIVLTLALLAAAAPSNCHGMEQATAGGGRISLVSRHEDQVPVPFRLTAESFTWQRTATRRFDSFETFKVTFASPVTTADRQNNTVHCEYFTPQGDGPFPAVVVLHILGGDFELSRICCRALASSNVAAMFLKMPYYGPRRPPGSQVHMVSADPQQSIASMTQAVKDIRRAVDWLADRDEVDSKRLGITGISLGGIVASLAAAAEPRFGKACLVLAGGDFATLIAESTEMDYIRRAWQGREIAPAEVGKLLRPIDPLTYATRLQDRQVLMINARKDKVIPRACTESLWKAAGEPELIWWNAGHYSAAKYFPFGLMTIVRFFQPASDSDL